MTAARPGPRPVTGFRRLAPWLVTAAAIAAVVAAAWLITHLA